MEHGEMLFFFPGDLTRIRKVGVHES
jgi:hypothetical protein